MVRARTFVWFSLLPQFSGGLDSGLAPVLFQIFVRHDFTANKLVLEVRTSKILGEVDLATPSRHTELHLQLGVLWSLFG